MYKPSWVRLRPLIDELRQGTLIGNGHLRDLDEHVTRLQSGPSQPLQSFLSHCKGVGKGLWPIAKGLLQQLMDGKLLDGESTAQLARAVHWGTALEPTVFVPLLREQLGRLTEAYACRLAFAPETADGRWFLQCENVLIQAYRMVGSEADVLQAKELYRFQERRLSEGASALHGDAKKTYCARRHARAKRACETVYAELETALWQRVGAQFLTHTKACHGRMEALVEMAFNAGATSIADLDLPPYQQTLLGMHTAHRQPLRWLDGLLALRAIGLKQAGAWTAEQLEGLSAELAGQLAKLHQGRPLTPYAFFSAPEKHGAPTEGRSPFVAPKEKTSCLTAPMAPTQSV